MVIWTITVLVIWLTISKHPEIWIVCALFVVFVPLFGLLAVTAVVLAAVTGLFRFVILLLSL